MSKILFAALGSLFLGVTALGQTTSGSFRGTVTDQSGAVVPGAAIKMTDVAKGVSTDTKSGADGYYEFLNVAPGVYDFTITYSGFETLTNHSVVLLLNQIATLNFVLKPGAVTQQVTITSQAPLINSTNATAGTVIEHTQVTQLPLNGREFTQMILLTPGAAPHGANQQGAFELSSSLGAISPAVNGLQGDMNSFTVDGVENNELFFNFVAISPPPDAIQEFKVQSYISDGAFGRAPGANVSIETRSGGNQLHGGAWEFLRNDAFDSRNFFAAARSPFRQNQFGVDAGGPIRKNKVWAFGWYEGLRKSIGSVNLGVVPTPAELAGDFAGYSNPIFNPFTTKATGTGSSGNPVFARDPFPGNTIPASMMNSAAVTLAKHFYPAPNLAAGPGHPNFINTEPITTDWDQWSARVDAALPKSTMLFTRFSWFNGTRLNPGLVPTTGIGLTNNMDQAVLGLTRGFSPTTVFSFHMQFLRTNLLQHQVGSCLPTSTLQSTGLLNSFNFPGQEGVPVCNPSIGISDFAGLPGQTFVPIGPTNNWEYRADLTKIVGKHTVTLGASVVRSWLFSSNGYADASFNNLPTSDPQNSANTGSGLASFLLGIPSGADREAGDGGQSLFGNYYGLYVNDQWRVTPKLTATLGLRYDYASPLQDTRGRIAAPDWNASTASNIVWDVDQTASELHGINLVANPAPGITIQRVPSGLFEPDRDNFAPRVALAYSLHSTTALHAGYGIFYEFNQSLFQTEDDIMGNWPFGNPFFAPAGLNVPSAANPLPTNVLGVNVFPPVTFSAVPPIGGGLFAAQRNITTPYVQEWDAGIDHAFRNNWSLSVMYLGSKGTNIDQAIRINTAPTPGSGPINPRRRIPQLGTTVLDGHWFNSSYNALEAKVEKRYSQGLTLLGSYTYSKSIDEGSATHQGNVIQDTNDFRASRGLSDYDLTHNFVLSSIYDLPFGEGKKYFSGSGWASKYLIGKWQISGILTLNNGFPFNITIPSDNANVGLTGQRPSIQGSLVPLGFQQTPNHWFDTSALYVVPYTFGSLGRNVIRQDTFKNLDFAVLKQFPIGETRSIEFRGEFFNIFNHPNFAAPVSSLGSGIFGDVVSMNGSPRDIQFSLKLNF